jgi:hypothetical protein
MFDFVDCFLSLFNLSLDTDVCIFFTSKDSSHNQYQINAGITLFYFTFLCIDFINSILIHGNTWVVSWETERQLLSSFCKILVNFFTIIKKVIDLTDIDSDYSAGTAFQQNQYFEDIFYIK